MKNIKFLQQIGSQQQMQHVDVDVENREKLVTAFKNDFSLHWNHEAGITPKNISTKTVSVDEAKEFDKSAFEATVSAYRGSKHPAAEVLGQYLEKNKDAVENSFKYDTAGKLDLTGTITGLNSWNQQNFPTMNVTAFSDTQPKGFWDNLSLEVMGNMNVGAISGALASGAGFGRAIGEAASVADVRVGLDVSEHYKAGLFFNNQIRNLPVVGAEFGYQSIDKSFRASAGPFIGTKDTFGEKKYEIGVDPDGNPVVNVTQPSSRPWGIGVGLAAETGLRAVPEFDVRGAYVTNMSSPDYDGKGSYLQATATAFLKSIKVGEWGTITPLMSVSYGQGTAPGMKLPAEVMYNAGVRVKFGAGKMGNLFSSVDNEIPGLPGVSGGDHVPLEQSAQLSNSSGIALSDEKSLENATSRESERIG